MRRSADFVFGINQVLVAYVERATVAESLRLSTVGTWRSFARMRKTRQPVPAQRKTALLDSPAKPALLAYQSTLAPVLLSAPPTENTTIQLMC
jgi:hypothetical protein